jgi:hypothetical protein
MPSNATGRARQGTPTDVDGYFGTDALTRTWSNLTQSIPIARSIKPDAVGFTGFPPPKIPGETLSFMTNAQYRGKRQILNRKS